MAKKKVNMLKGPISPMDFVSRFNDSKKVILIGDDAYVFTEFVSEEMCLQQNHKGSKSYEGSLLITCRPLGSNGKKVILMISLPASNEKLMHSKHSVGFIHTPDKKEANKERLMEHFRNSDVAMACIEVDNSFIDIEPYQISDSISFLHELLTDIQEIAQIPIFIISEESNLPIQICNWADKILDCNCLPDDSKMFTISDVTSQYIKN